ncbi:MAG: zinc-dependent metalloprotease [Phycisphaerales bacterium]|nr:zinc-dependent metalloprotease [Phycisphaerales bacterium]MCI0630499.1 zinc-dependent metalloprotease [Phycisphaerales bacterium]MCI0677072.1 zinc-dependent metalloprotease [Phycisphaerales bacterium]
MKRGTKLAMVAPLSAAAITLAAMAAEPNKPTSGNPNEPDQLPPEIAARMAQMQGGGSGPSTPEEFPKWEDVSKDFTKVISTADGEASLYTIYTRQKDSQMLAELPRNFDSQRLFIAFTVAGGTQFSGVQTGDMYAQWKRYDKQLALIEPNIAVRTTGDLESTKGRDRVFTDRVILSVPIVCMGPNGGPVIDMDGLLLGQGSNFFGGMVNGANPSLASIVKAKAYPRNVELGFELPIMGGRLVTLYYSISSIPENTGYQPRVADTRVGYFATTHRDVGNAGADTPWVRYVNRWKLEKADPKLKLSPPKEPIVFYLEHTIPVRYRRWVRDGVLEWNRAFEKCGITNAIEVYQQDARTGAHMDKDPEDARYNFVLWTNAGMGFAIGPSRVDPRTGQIIDADIVMDEGFITSWVRAWQKIIPQTAMEGLGPETYAWLATRPKWDPRVRLASPPDRDNMIKQLAMDHANHGPEYFGGHPAVQADPTLMGDDLYDGLSGRVSQMNGMCMHAMAKSIDVAMFRLAPDLFAELAAGTNREDAPKVEGDVLDGVPEWFIGPLLKDVVMHEAGHVMGLRHNFKASSIYSVKEINTPEFKGKAQTGSVMDYNPININFGDGPVQGDWTMVTIGPYDYWAIEYGYSFESDLKPILAKVSEELLPYATDEDTWGPDPLARRFDYGANPLDYADSQLRLVKDLRGKILDRMVKDGESWSKAREGYEILLGRHFGAVSIAANWIGGSNVNRDKKGDPGNRDPVTPVSVEQQRRALTFVIDNAFKDDAYGLTPELLAKMTVDKWWDEGGQYQIFEDPTWPVHDRILSLQAAALTMVMNPTRLNRVFDNEFRVPGDSDALTLPEVIFGISDAIWSETNQSVGSGYSARKPMISSLRRNLQREHLERLIDLSLPNGGFGASEKVVSNLSVFKLRELSGKIEKLLKDSSKIDPYTLAHVSECKVRIDKALDAQYIYNTDDIGGFRGYPMFFGHEEEPAKR